MKISINKKDTTISIRAPKNIVLKAKKGILIREIDNITIIVIDANTSFLMI